MKVFRHGSRAAVSALVGLGLATAGTTASAASSPKWAKKGSTIVKCKGIVRKGKNDCGANAHQCSGMAKKDRDPNEWIYVPKGICKKIAGGVVLGEKKV